MHLRDLSALPATHTGTPAKALIADMIAHDRGWIYFQASFEPLTPYLSERFVLNHARVPGILTATRRPLSQPLAVLRYVSLSEHLIESVIFLNGAVVRMTAKETDNLFLFISEEDAKFWNYPMTGRRIAGFDIE